MTAGRGGRHYSIIFQRDGDLHARTWRVPRWAIRAAVATGALLLLGVVLATAFYAPIARQAARVPFLTRDVERLETDNRRIRELAAALDSVEAGYERLRQMVGADIVPDRFALGNPLPVAPPVYAAIPANPPMPETSTTAPPPAPPDPPDPPAPLAPDRWPLDERGFVTRGQAQGGGGEEHPGIDIAVPVGSVVRAAGNGVVLQTGTQAEYGWFVLLSHPNGYQTMYGHLSRILAVEGAPVGAGEVIALSGNSGRSSAPHLHFEIRLNGVSIDPGTLVKEAR